MVDYSAGGPALPEATHRCPTGAIQWLEAAQFDDADSSRHPQRGPICPASLVPRCACCDRSSASPPQAPGPYAGTTTALDGNTAVAVTEAGIGEAAGLGASYPGRYRRPGLARATAATRRKPAGETLWSHTADGPRGALATAIGLSLSGIRATAFLSSADLAGAQDLLASAAGRHLPLVAHLSNRALAGHASAMGSGHEALHISADSGCFMLFAANVQEAVDLTLIARRVAEQTLIPGLVIMDGDQTALAMQDVRLPDTNW